MISIIHDEETEEQRDKLEGSDTTVQVDICPESCRDMVLLQVLTALYNPRPSFSLHVLPSPSKVQVLYGGTDLFDYEVRRTFNNDMLLAFISSSCIAALVYILTSCSGRASPKAFSPPSVLLSGQSLPSQECQK